MRVSYPIILLLQVFLTSADLVGIIQVSRHGARSPLKKYPWDESPWEVNLGELTREGSMQHYIIGKEFRERYIIKKKLINPTLLLPEVYVRSTDLHRTIMSAQAQMMGFFPIGPELSSPFMHFRAVPPFEVLGINNTIAELKLKALPYAFQPIPIDVYENVHDYLLLGYSKSCQMMEEYVKDSQESEEYKKWVVKYERGIKKDLEKALGMQNIEFDEAAFVADSLECVKFHDFHMPDGVDDSLYEKMMELKDFSNSYLFNIEAALKLATSAFYMQLLETFDDIIYARSTTKYKVYFSHDKTLISLLIALDSWDSKNPPFASTLLFELHNEDSEYKVKIIYNDEVIKLESICENELCSYKDLKDYLDSWVDKDYQESCYFKGPRQYRKKDKSMFLDGQS
ncbi:hypothetical protein SteCoe_2581 [Stentor coeruleus]|uniref:Acid phosphatase n=1 Tax=Stentor coeruleus TaxID=5963 RepID=A0A1R2CZ08_9CILI|nr:hypothetical protein SteCoe_2581 [Stentor coeruleus]